MKVFSRRDWGARAPHAMVMSNSPAREAFLHHSDDPSVSSFNSLSARKAKVRQIQDFHMDSRGWSDIAYHYVVFQPLGTLPVMVFDGRNKRAVPAAQLNHNTHTIAICVVGNTDHDTIHPDTVKAIEALILRHPNVKKIGGHRDVTPTGCPGKNLYAKVPDIARALKLGTV